jgi:hypothetical protein
MGPHAKYHPWAEQEIVLLGTMPDHDLARLLRRHPSCVLSKRLALRVPYRNPRSGPWSSSVALGEKPQPSGRAAKCSGCQPGDDTGERRQ